MKKGIKMQLINGKIKAIIFDMDGTIIQTDAIWRSVSLQLLAHYGIDSLNPDQIAYVFYKLLMGKSMPDGLKALIAHFNIPTTPQAMMVRKIALANEHFSKPIEYIAGFNEFHKTLTSLGIATGIATNAVPENLAVITQSLNFQAQFGKHIYSIADVDYKGKPNPAIFLHAAHMLGAAPDECIVFEDSYVGFMAAKAAGMKCIAIKNHHNQSHLRYVDDAIENYYAAPAALERIIATNTSTSQQAHTIQ
jgi:beta-phosphoglucomutase-like phosphatase (HAD superfamily)